MKEIKEELIETLESLDIPKVLLGLMITGIFVFVLYLFLQPKTYYIKSGVLVDKTYQPAYTTLMPITVCDGKGGCTTTTQTQYHPEVYNVLVLVNQTVETYSVSKQYYGTHQKDDPVSIGCWKGKVISVILCDVQE